MTLQEYKEKIENLNKLAKRAGVSPSVVYRALDGADINLSTAMKLVEASGYKLNFTALANVQSRRPAMDTPPV